ncbi:MAG: GEVED domain-containing protein [Flavobacteriales bacterium]
MKNLYLSLSFAALAFMPAVEGLSQVVQGQPNGPAQLVDKAQRASAQRTMTNSASHAMARVRWHQDSHGVAQLRGGGIANDLCANAEVLTVNAPGGCPGSGIAGNNGGAGNDGGDPACDVTATAFEDVWYAFNSGTSTSITIAFTQGTIADLLVEVLEGGCGGTSIFCDFTALSYTIPVSAGTDYLIRVASNNDFGAGGTFDICLTGSGGGGTPPNDDCGSVTATNLASGASVIFTGDNTGASSAGDVVPGSVLDVGGDTTIVWHMFTTTECNDVTIAYCGTLVQPAVYWATLATSCPADDNVINFSGGNFTDCLDGNATIVWIGLPAGTYYLPVRGEPATAGPYTIEVSAVACATAGPYCEAGATIAQFEKISNVTVAGINNNSTSSAGYEDFTGGTAGSMTVGMSYPLSVSISGAYDTDEVRVWVDFDQSDSFEAGELVFTSPLGVGPHTGNILVPVGAATGSTRMRVRLHDTYDGVDYFNFPNPTPCDTSTFGQVEDYTVNIGGGGNTPPNDDCTGAVAQNLAAGATISLSGDNTGATEDGGAGFVIVWEAFTTTECTDVTINYCVPGSVFTNFLTNLSVNCPDFLTGLLAGAFDACTVTFTDLAAGTYYIPVLVDPATTPVGAYTIEVSAVACGPLGPYCEAGATSLQFEKISNTTFSDINNNSTSNAGYEDFTGVTGQVVGGVDYNISVTISGGYDTDQVLAWIDFDQSQTFDASELVFTSGLGVGPHTGIVSVPLTASQGPTRMRVRLHDTYDLGIDYFNFPNPTPCDTSTFGQVEDYTVDVIGVITGVNENPVSAFTVFPNPTNGDVDFVSSAADAMTVITVLDMTGREVYSEKRQLVKGQQVHLPLAGSLAAGTYSLRLTSEFGRGEQRFVVR